MKDIPLTPNIKPIYRFSNPPVVESVLGVQFEPLAKFKIGHLGAFWKALGPEWPATADAPAIEPQFETFGTRVWGGATFKITEELQMRTQIRNERNDRMVQIQNGRLHYNWLGQDGAQYAEYEKVRPEFDKVLQRFLSFLQTEGLGELKPNQWEVTYVNHIFKGPAWISPQDWPELFVEGWPFPAPLGEIVLESFGGEWHFEIPNRKGRIHIGLTHGKPRGKEEALILVLTARGPVQPVSLNGLSAGLDLGRATIVETFKRLTSAKAHTLWGLTP